LKLKEVLLLTLTQSPSAIGIVTDSAGVTEVCFEERDNVYF